MSDFTTTPNMMLPLPIPGVEPGPEYAVDQNTAFTLVDSHDHSSGKGVQVTPAGINVNTDLPFLGNNAVSLRSARFSAQSSPLALPTDLACAYVSGVDLYFNDGSGNQVRITQSGGVAGSPGSIAGLASPASATYVAGTQTFVWQSNTNTPANLDAGFIILRNNVASSKGLTLEPPAAMASDYTIILPTLPASQKFLTLDASGNMAASWAPDNVTTEIASNLLRVKAAGISSAQLASNLNLPGTNVQVNSKNVMVNGNNVGSSETRLIWGEQALNGSPTPVVGNGWSCTGHSLTGEYVITFTTPFSGLPSIVATARQDAYYCTILSRSASGCTIRTWSGASLLDSNFTFHAVGPA